MTKQEVSDVIYNELCYMYCDNCRHNYEIEDDACDDCHRKYNGWGISRAEADYIANKICIGSAIPPIAIGTGVYFINVFKEIEHGTVSMIQQKADKTWKFRISTSRRSVFDLSTNEIGKSVFLNSAEAEKHLKGY